MTHARRLGTSLWLSVWLALSGVSCARDGQLRNAVVGVITPEYFRFRVTVADNDRALPSGGWRAVCIHALIKHGDSDAKTVCKFEVGVPLRTEKDGEVPLEQAQFAAASMANRAAREVLSEAHPREMFAVLCNRFRDVYKLMLETQIPGARVGVCRTAGIETVLFGITRDEPAP